MLKHFLLQLREEQEGLGRGWTSVRAELGGAARDSSPEKISPEIRLGPHRHAALSSDLWVSRDGGREMEAASNPEKQM